MKIRFLADVGLRRLVILMPPNLPNRDAIYTFIRVPPRGPSRAFRSPSVSLRALRTSRSRYTLHMEFVESRNGGLYVAGSRVSLASLIYGFRGGDSPETIQHNFPSLSLAHVYGALAYYLSHPAECEADLQALDERWDALEKIAHPIARQKSSA